MSCATHMLFEELQPATVFTFGLPHFGECLDLKTPDLNQAFDVVANKLKSTYLLVAADLNRTNFFYYFLFIYFIKYKKNG